MMLFKKSAPWARRCLAPTGNLYLIFDLHQICPQPSQAVSKKQKPPENVAVLGLIRLDGVIPHQHPSRFRPCMSHN
jgi:hypothetical protein